MALTSEMRSSGGIRISIEIAIIYLVVGALWISFSDKLVGVIFRDRELITEISMIKGWGFVLITGFMLYGLIERWTLKLERSQREARYSDAKYREIVESAHSIILSLDTSCNVTFLNGFAQQFFGCTKDEAIGRSVFHRIFPPVDTDGRDLRALVEDIALNHGACCSYGTENIIGSDERVWVAWTVKPVVAEDGRTGGILCIGNDITKRKRAEEALRESEAKFRSYVEHAPLAVFVSDG
ncbi:MAG: PAS domain-containing protein, partial [Syntrophobacteraceae bacterium]